MSATADRHATLRVMAAAAGREYAEASPQEILKWAIETFDDEFCLAASMGDAVLIDMVDRIRPGVDVVFLETGYHFPETLQTRDEVASRYGVRVLTTLPLQTIAQQDELFGPQLHDRDPDACCNLRKVEPLRRSLAPYTAWASGIRRDETDNRKDIGVIDWDANRGMVKVNPLAAWTQDDVDDYIDRHEVVVNPLLAQGYPSIGCAPCTRKVAPGEDPRSGRWAGSGKSECGLHIDGSGKLVRGAALA